MTTRRNVIITKRIRFNMIWDSVESSLATATKRTGRPFPGRPVRFATLAGGRSPLGANLLHDAVAAAAGVADRDLMATGPGERRLAVAEDGVLEADARGPLAAHRDADRNLERA